jgi:hypothetical protein
MNSMKCIEPSYIRIQISVQESRVHKSQHTLRVPTGDIYSYFMNWSFHNKDKIVTWNRWPVPICKLVLAAVAPRALSSQSHGDHSHSATE